MQPFTERTIYIIQNIPAGKVMTYGQIAALAGSPRAARQVVRILHTMSDKYGLPWHRVVNKQGRIVLRDDEMAWLQRELLENEEIEVSFQGELDLSRYRWDC
ncbi:MGMT family protein [Virgibacillus halophilus]|uniref:MGMT family protein n=1 Tax=Tigheibacillus halophilus TaxID=361280 RepID=A0ABU5C4X2_9BACI|nr:MGMT family protein [Virgibacillus halophilus]